MKAGTKRRPKTSKPPTPIPPSTIVITRKTRAMEEAFARRNQEMPKATAARARSARRSAAGMLLPGCWRL